MKRFYTAESVTKGHPDKLNKITSKWHGKSRDIGGQSAQNFLIHVVWEQSDCICGKGRNMNK